MRGQGQLDQDPVDRGIRIQPVDQREQLGPAGGCRQVVRDRHDAGFLAGAALVAHVDRGGGVVADHHDGEPGPAQPTALERIRPGPDLAPELLRDPLAIDDLCAHKPAALLKSPMASTRTATASRSAAVRCGFHTSMISTTRVLDAAVPGFVLVGVVEYDGLALAPCVLLAADDERAVLRNDERQVTDDPRVGDAAVRQDVRARRQHREHHLGRVLADPHERQRLEDRRSSRAQRVVLVAPLAMAVEVEAVPAWRAARALEAEVLGLVAGEDALARAPRAASRR